MLGCKKTLALEAARGLPIPPVHHGPLMFFYSYSRHTIHTIHTLHTYFFNFTPYMGISNPCHCHQLQAAASGYCEWGNALQSTSLSTYFAFNTTNTNTQHHHHFSRYPPPLPLPPSPLPSLHPSIWPRILLLFYP